MASTTTTKCQDCGGTSINREEHHFESLDVCHSCGSSAVNVDDQLRSSHPAERFRSSPSRKPLSSKHDGKTRGATIRLPLQLRGHVESTRRSGARRECERQLRLALDRLKQPSTGSVADEARHLLDKVNLSGRSFKRECLAAACCFVALRTHKQDTSMARVVELLGVELVETNRVVSHIAKSRKDLEVQGRRFPEIDDLAKGVFKGCQFWNQDGSAVDNARMLQRVVNLVGLLGRIPVSNVYLSESFLLAAAHLVYKSEDLRSRSRMSLGEFAAACRIEGVTDRSSAQVTKCSQVVVKCLKTLVERLPYAGETRTMKSNDVLRYLEDVEKHREMLVESVQQQHKAPPGSNESKPCASSSSSSSPSSHATRSNFNCASLSEDDDSLDEGEIDSYIRTEEEVSVLKPLYDKLSQ